MLQCVAMETLILQVAYMILFVHLDPGSNLAPMQISPVQNMLDGDKLVADIVQTSLITPFF